MNINNFEIYRWKKAGMTNLGVNRLLKFFRQHPDLAVLSARQMGQIAQTKHLADFVEAYKRQDLTELETEFKKFPSFSILDEMIYPAHLREIYNPPALLFYQGDLGHLRLGKLAFVGARDAGKFGLASTYKLIHELDSHFAVVSGLARGIDKAAHIAAIKTETPTIAVIGTGLDVYYPAENHALQEYLAKKHLILSEYGPGERALKWHFPDRNRIIAGLSRGVVVVEAKLRSGSLITAERAMEEGRDVFAVPGNISDGMSDGCHHLIQEGAKLVFRATDILEEYALSC